MAKDSTKYAPSKTDYIELDVDNKVDVSDIEVKPAINLKWNYNGSLEFYNPNIRNVSFRIEIYRDGEHFTTWSTGNNGIGKIKINTFYNIDQTGAYTYKVYTYEYGVDSWENESKIVSELSPTFNYVKPDAQVYLPNNIKWSSNGVLSWNRSSNVLYYDVELRYVDPNNQNGWDPYVPNTGRYISSLSIDYKEYLGSGYKYYALIKSISKDINRWTHSEWSAPIYFVNGEVVEAVNNTLDSKLETLSAESSAEDVKTAVDSVKESFKDSLDELQISMQTDENTQKKIADLEKIYEETNGIKSETSVAADLGIQSSSVSILGASLNAKEAGDVTFSMKKPDEELVKDLITNTHYNNAIVFDMDLSGAGVNGGELDIPVTITMPVPNGINPYRLVIQHYKSDGTFEWVDVRLNSDNTISFTVTHFSNFLFGESDTNTINPESPEVPEEPDVPDTDTPVTPAEPERNDSSSSSTSSTPVVVVKKDIEETTTADGAVFHMNGNTKLSDATIAKYAGTDTTMLIHMGKGIGYTIKANQAIKAVDLGVKVEAMATFAEGFDTIHIIPAKEEELGFELGLHIKVGEDFAGKTAFIFKKNLATGQYELVSTGAVNEIGNVCVSSTSLSDVMVLIAK